MNARVLFLHGLESPVGPDGVACGRKATFLRQTFDAAGPDLRTGAAIEAARGAVEQTGTWRYPFDGYDPAFAAPMAVAKDALAARPRVVVASSFGAAVMLRAMHEGLVGEAAVVLMAGAGPKLTPWRTLPPGPRVLLIHGLGDDVVPAADSLELFRSSPDAALLLVDDVHGLPTTVGPTLERAVRWGLGERPVGAPVPGYCVRPERPGDEAAVRRVHTEAFPGPEEAGIVERIRGSSDSLASLVAEDRAGEVIGHVLFVRVDLGGVAIAGLAPLAVRPDHHRRGVGMWLGAAGLDALRAVGERACVVLGDPGYYARLGFEPSGDHGVDNEYGVPSEVFRVMALTPGGLDRLSGLATYPKAFAEAGV